MPAPPQSPANFREILQFVWWRLDRALTPEAVEMSALIGALDAVRSGTTSLIDHHASPAAIEGSLDRIEAGMARAGVRGVLCYETTDRNGGEAEAARGLAENRRYMEKCRARTAEGAKQNPKSLPLNSKRNLGRDVKATGDLWTDSMKQAAQFAAMPGAHAAFTCGDSTLTALARLAEEFNTGVHFHAAEDPCDDAICRREYGAPLADRLDRFGLLRADSILAHGTHLDARAIERVRAAGTTVAHNPRSNMNNAVGYAPIAQFRGQAMLGTDGIGSDMFAEARAAWLKSCDAHAGFSPADVIAMLAASARRAGRALGEDLLGRLAAGAPADVIVTDYAPATPLDSSNAAGHFLFALDSRHVKNVMVGGRWVMRDRAMLTCDEAAFRRASRDIAARLWRAMSALA